MRVSFRTKLLAIPGAAVLSFALLIAAQTVLSGRMESHLSQIQGHFIPIIELRPRVEAGFEHLRRGFQDSVAAQDREELQKTQAMLAELLDGLKAAQGVADAARVAELGEAIRDYAASARGVSTRLISGETGAGVLEAMSEMQGRQARVEALLKTALVFDRASLLEAFASVERSQRVSARILLVISFSCLLVVSLLSGVLGRGVLRSLEALSAGLKRFGQGNFSEPVTVPSRDELGDLADEANRMAARTRALMRELESFSYSVAHDLRAPLRGILGFGKILLEDHGPSLDDDAKRTIERVLASARRMGQLIDSLLSLSRLARTELKKERVDLSVIGREVLAELQGAQPDRKVALRVHDGLTARGDAALLRIVLTNLLGNAWKFSSRTGAASIELGRARARGGDAFFVRDNGAGFDMQYAGKLFGTFQRLHSDADFEGTGIGLATVQTIVHRHGGEIWADGKLGEGAVFYFNLEKLSKGDTDERSDTAGRG